MNSGNSDIADEVKKFVYKYIESVSILEVLLLLYNNSLQVYNAEMIAQELRTSTESVMVNLQDLMSYGFLVLEDVSNSMYQYNRGNKDDNCIRQLNTTYLNYRHTLITLIFSKPSDSVRSFADAFKFKKDNE